jgi:trk system potassium uptake protein TrkA
VYILIAGGGKVGANLTGALVAQGHEVTLMDNDRERYRLLEERFGAVVRYGDATELALLERAGVERADLLVAVTGDDEDNVIVCQVARDKYGVPKVIARVNDPRNQEHFELLGITQTICATSSILGLVEHEMPEHGLVRLLELQKEGLEIVEAQIESSSPAAGTRVAGLALPDGSRLISVFRHGRTELVEPGTVLRPGDQVLAVVADDSATELRRVLLGAPK